MCVSFILLLLVCECGFRKNWLFFGCTRFAKSMPKCGCSLAFCVRLYCIVSIHLYSASCSAHQSETMMIRPMVKTDFHPWTFRYLDISPGHFPRKLVTYTV